MLRTDWNYTTESPPGSDAGLIMYFWVWVKGMGELAGSPCKKQPDPLSYSPTLLLGKLRLQSWQRREVLGKVKQVSGLGDTQN